jgi:transposase
LGDDPLASLQPIAAAWEAWKETALESGIPSLIRFARNLAPFIPGIIANTSVLEGINNRIKVIKRMAYGFRDDAYFFLKIRAAFPANPG